MKRLALLGALAALTHAPAAAQAPTGIRLNHDTVAPGVYHMTMLSDQGPVLANVTAVDGGSAALIVDTHAGQAQPAFQGILSSLGVGPVTWAVNTHWHPDHTLGNTTWSGTGATVISHERTREILSRPQHATGLTGPGTELSPPAREGAGLPAETFSDRRTLQVGDLEVELIHPGPGHTDGDAIVWIPERNVVHLGDMFWPDAFPSIDLENGGSATGLRDAIGEVLSWLPDDVVVLSGHAPRARKEQLEHYHRMLVETIATIEERVAEGMTVGEIAVAGFGDEWETWTWDLVPTEQWVRLVVG